MTLPCVLKNVGCSRSPLYSVFSLPWTSIHLLAQFMGKREETNKQTMRNRSSDKWKKKWQLVCFKMFSCYNRTSKWKGHLSTGLKCINIFSALTCISKELSVRESTERTFFLKSFFYVLALLTWLDLKQPYDTVRYISIIFLNHLKYFGSMVIISKRHFLGGREYPFVFISAQKWRVSI